MSPNTTTTRYFCLATLAASACPAPTHRHRQGLSATASHASKEYTAKVAALRGSPRLVTRGIHSNDQSADSWTGNAKRAA